MKARVVIDPGAVVIFVVPKSERAHVGLDYKPKQLVHRRRLP